MTSEPAQNSTHRKPHLAHLHLKLPDPLTNQAIPCDARDGLRFEMMTAFTVRKKNSAVIRLTLAVPYNPFCR